MRRNQIQSCKPFLQGDLAVFEDGPYGNGEYFSALGALVSLSIREAVNFSMATIVEGAKRVTLPS